MGAPDGSKPRIQVIIAPFATKSIAKHGFFYGFSCPVRFDRLAPSHTANNANTMLAIKIDVENTLICGGIRLFLMVQIWIG